jgi:hypothetical protein
MKINYLIMSIRFVDVKTKVLFSFKPIVIYFDIKKCGMIEEAICCIIVR